VPRDVAGSVLFCALPDPPNSRDVEPISMRKARCSLSAAQTTGWNITELNREIKPRRLCRHNKFGARMPGEMTLTNLLSRRQRSAIVAHSVAGTTRFPSGGVAQVGGLRKFVSESRYARRSFVVDGAGVCSTEA